MKLKYIVVITLVVIGIMVVYDEYQLSFSDPLDVIYQTSNQIDAAEVKAIFPAYKINGKALYFYVNKYDNIVAVQLTKGIMGWKLKSASTGSGLSIRESISGPFNGYNRSGTFIFGLASEEVVRVEVNDVNASVVPLDFYFQEVNPNTNKLWYSNIDKDANDISLRAFNSSNTEI